MGWKELLACSSAGAGKCHPRTYVVVPHAATTKIVGSNISHSNIPHGIGLAGSCPTWYALNAKVGLDRADRTQELRQAGGGQRTRQADAEDNYMCRNRASNELPQQNAAARAEAHLTCWLVALLLCGQVDGCTES
jgi:hypothetical protein